MITIYRSRPRYNATSSVRRRIEKALGGIIFASTALFFVGGLVGVLVGSGPLAG